MIGHGTHKSYFLGFLWSIVFTFAAYFLVVDQFLSTSLVISSIMVLAVLQLWVQLHFFLHLGQESHPRWNQLVFAFMLLTLAILMIGSLWIMHHLNYNMIPQLQKP